ncbi:helicase-related protein [uncultured Rubinisphaera sp.]|uniref:C-terminal helicase domain-containing protein n=1 Tax=uncultured Rubinisphaera sp. TaxID=1678686 RepID=UPI0030D8F7B4
MNDLQETTVQWLTERILAGGRGDGIDRLEVKPSGRFWLGRLAPEMEVINSPIGDRFERMEPCAMGIRLKPATEPPWEFNVEVRCRVWVRRRVWVRQGSGDDAEWTKSELLAARTSVSVVDAIPGAQEIPFAQFDTLFSNATSVQDHSVTIRIERQRSRGQLPDLVVSCVNTSNIRDRQPVDPCLYEVEMRLSRLETSPFLLEGLPDSFRYDRQVPAYGINCGVVQESQDFRTTDLVVVDRGRPRYWHMERPEPNLTFETLANDPMPHLEQLVEAHRDWGAEEWSANRLAERASEEKWTSAMREEAEEGANAYREEARRLQAGLGSLRADPTLLRCFQLTNRAMKRSSRGKYEGWRSFQIGFLLANLECLRDSANSEDETSDPVEILWFATGGGKTETYLGLLVMAAFHDRLTGKTSGITAWSRFPLRLLSLQQTQRFANAVAAAELVRKEEGIGGATFSLGFFVGQGGTPNKIERDSKPGFPDPDDPEMPAQNQILMACPFCDSGIEMGFDRRTWRLAHRCASDECVWGDKPLPFYVVDSEIFRFLPTIVVGTLDKVALIGFQAAMRGFIGSPSGICSGEMHGYTYAERSKSPNGCQVPDCDRPRNPLPMDAKRYRPSIRLQDELHLLRDSLGAIDAHYESLLDYLIEKTSDFRPKIIASSATLTGYRQQCDVLYRRQGRVFPALGPTATESFWTVESDDLLRRYVAIAPRGATLEFAADRIVTILQTAVRDLLTDQNGVRAALGVDDEEAKMLVDLYGTDVVYGNTIRDLDASVRSLETQIPLEPLKTATLTGHTPFPEVRDTLERLEHPEEDFNERLHVIAASTMMSHGVDIDRLNVMLMLGVPLTTAEFIQATARIGRKHPGLVFVLHKMALERDASVHRSFTSFVRQGDRFVEPIPISRRSANVLRRTFAGLEQSRQLQLLEPSCGARLTTVANLARFVSDGGMSSATELDELAEMLGLEGDLDERLRSELQVLVETFFRQLDNPPSDAIFPSDLYIPSGPMRSLRDVEEQAPVRD